MSGQRLLGVPILVKPTQAEKNRLPNPVGSNSSNAVPQIGPMKLYVGSLHVNITEEMLRGIFEPFGRVCRSCGCKKIITKLFLTRLKL